MTQEDLRARFQQVIDQTVDGRKLFSMELGDRMAEMAKLGREIVRIGIEEFFVAAVMTASDVVFPATVIYGDDHKEEIKKRLIALAHERNPLCVIIVMPAWGVKATPENFQPYLRNSEHPDRQEALVVDGKDQFEHLTGIQFIRRSENNVDFGELQIGSSGRSWLDEWHVKTPAVPTC